VKKLKQWMQRLEEIKEPNETNFANLEDILEEIGLFIFLSSGWY
jgi:hypothetical protein